VERYKVAARWNKFLATRERGRQVREDLELHLSRLPAGDTLVVDFSGVKGITASFADESVAKLIMARASGDFADRGMVIEGSNEDVRETLEAVLVRRKLAVVTIAASGQPLVLGEIDWLPRTLAVAVDLHSFRASELAERLGITPQAANNRLRMLMATGAVARERVVPEGGGKEFGYKTAIPTYA
jgi:hypothetical protein